jgi:hypothetical protein
LGSGGDVEAAASQAECNGFGYVLVGVEFHY